MNTPWIERFFDPRDIAMMERMQPQGAPLSSRVAVDRAMEAAAHEDAPLLSALRSMTERYHSAQTRIMCLVAGRMADGEIIAGLKCQLQRTRGQRAALWVAASLAAVEAMLLVWLALARI